MTADHEIYTLLGIAVFERLGPGNYRAVGEPPQWWNGIAGSWTKSFSIPFVEEYLIEAEAFWLSDQEGLANAEVFQAESDGAAVTLDVVAASTRNSNLLLIRNLDIGGVGVTNVLQTARENRLRFDKEIDEHVELQIDLSRAKEAAELLSQAKTQFLANVSHEIRTPLTAVLGMDDLLADTTLDEEQRTFVETIQGSSDHLLRIINDLLDFSRVESGQFELESIPINVRSFAEQTHSRFIGRAKAQGLRYDVSVGDDVPETILGDPVRLAQVLDNLIGNALKFTSEGHIHAQFEMNPKNSSEMLLLVADTGVGISPEKQDLIFQSFVQEDASTTRRFGGTGLGLAIVRQLTTVMGGDVSLESRPGQGTTFFVSLPVQLELSSNDSHQTDDEQSVDQSSDDDFEFDIDFDEPRVDEAELVAEAKLVDKGHPATDDARSQRETVSSFESINWDENDDEGSGAEKDLVAAESGAGTENEDGSTKDGTGTVVFDWDNDKADSGSDWFGTKKKSTSANWFDGSSASGDSADSSYDECLDDDSDECKPSESKPSESIEAVFGSDKENGASRVDTTKNDEPEWEPPSLKERRPRPTPAAKHKFDDEPLESFVPPSRDRATTRPPIQAPYRKPKDISALRVLLAEDNAAIQMLLLRMLKKAGHTVVTADNGKQAIELMNDDIDLVLMDCQMPILDGFEATKNIRDLELEDAKQRVPIIALTAHAMAGFREKCIAQGMDDYLTKPLNQTDLESVIERTLGAKAPTH